MRLIWGVQVEEERSEGLNSIEQSSRDLNQIVFQHPMATLLEPIQAQQLSPSALAYLGDAVYELYVRTYYLMPPKRSQAYHQDVVEQVRAETQAKHLKILEPDLTPTELEILRRGRNSASGGPRRLDPKIYQQATSLETLIGYLYLIDPQRLAQLLAKIQLGSGLKE